MHTNTSGICLEERSTSDQPQSLALPHRQPSFCGAEEVKHHRLVGFGGFVITSEYFVQANHYGGKYSYTGSIGGITPWLHVMLINPQCKYCASLSGFFCLYHERKVFFLMLLIHVNRFFFFYILQKSWPTLLSVQSTGKKNCCFGKKTLSGWHKSLFKCNHFKLTLCKYTHTHCWNAELAPCVVVEAKYLENKHNCPRSKGGNTSHF